MPPHSKATAGFSLIQISILLTVASLLMVAVLPSPRATIQKQASSSTKINGILTALRQYQVATCTLPCPADPTLPFGAANYGRAAANNGTAGNCIGATPAAAYADTTNHMAIGMVPIFTIGLSYDYALDGWSRDITYAVDTNATNINWASLSLPGAITVNDNGVSQNSVVALVTHGQDGYGAWLPLQGATGTAVRLDNGSTDTSQADNAQVAHNGGLTANTTFASFVNQRTTTTFDDSVGYRNSQWNINAVPKIDQASITSPANGTYSSGSTLTFTVTSPQILTVTGTPRLVLSALSGGSIGTSNTAYATYVSGSGSNTLTFTYTVQSSDTAPNGLSMTTPVDLNGGTISPCLPFNAPDLSQVIIASCAAGYNYCRQITIDHTKVPNTDQTNFPVLISGTYSYLATVVNGGNVQNANGYDIIFTSNQTGTTKYNFERESYTASSGAVNFWVQVPTVSHSTDTTFYVQYGNASVVTDQSNKTGTWDSNYLGVWHFPNGTTLGANDSTSNALSGTINGTTSATTGQFGGGANSPGVSSATITFTRNAVLDSVFPGTWQAWIKPATVTSSKNMLIVSAYRTNASSSDFIDFGIEGSGAGGTAKAFMFCYAIPGVVCDQSNAVLSPNIWYFIAFTLDNTGKGKIYINGTLDSTTANGSWGPSLGSNKLRFGDEPDTGSNDPYSGILDEYRLSKTARSADWIKTEYNNQSSPSTFYTIGSR